MYCIIEGSNIASPKNGRQKRSGAVKATSSDEVLPATSKGRATSPEPSTTRSKRKATTSDEPLQDGSIGTRAMSSENYLALCAKDRATSSEEALTGNVTKASDEAAVDMDEEPISNSRSSTFGSPRGAKLYSSLSPTRRDSERRRVPKTFVETHVGR